MSLPHLKLTYFDIVGLAEASRLAFHIGGIPFEDERLTPQQFAEQKAAGRFPNGQVPVLYVNGQPHAQSTPILVYASRLAGLYPTDPLQAFNVDEILANIGDAGTVFAASAREPDQEKKKALRAEVAAGPLAAWVRRFEDILAKSTSGWFVGDSLTAADLKAYGFFQSFSTGTYDYIPTDYLKDYPHINAFVAKVRAHPKIAEYYAAKAQTKSFPKLKLTYFNFGGRAEPIRLAFHIGGVPFEDERLAGPEFAAAKAAGRFKNGSVPVLEIDGEQLAQSHAILLYAGSLAGHGLVPTDPLQLLKVNEVVANIEDTVGILRPSFQEADEKKRVELRTALIAADGALTAWVKRFDNALKQNGTGYFVGNHLTIADLTTFNFFHWVSSGLLDGIPKEWIHTFPEVSAFTQRIAAEPKIAEYYASRK